MKRNIKLQTVSAWSIALTGIVAVLCLAISCSATRKFQALLTATDQYILCEDAAKQLQSGEIDALFCTSGVKTEMIEELANSCGIALLPVDGSAAARLLAAYPAYSQGVIPAGSYNGQDQDVPTIGVKAVLLASDELSENTVKALTKTLYDGVDTLQAELGLPLELGPADKIGVPVHAGAAAYYQENGMAAGEDAA